MATYRVRTQDHGRVGGFTATVSIDGGATWKSVPLRLIGGGLVSFDSKAQTLKAADKFARNLMAKAV